jgi:hypothetical protein
VDFKLNVWPSHVKLLVGFQPNFTGVIITIPSCAQYQQVLRHCTKWLPGLKIEKSCPAFTGQTSDGISTKLYRSDKFQPLLCTSPACSPLLHKMAARAMTFVIQKSCPTFTIQTFGGISTKTLQE